MTFNRSGAAGAMFEGDDESWWITGGYGDDLSLNSTETYTVTANGFGLDVDMPKELNFHNLINVNCTHMVVLGGNFPSHDVFIYDR